MSTDRVDYLFRGSHPAFYWAAALLKQKGKSVAILPEPSVHSWELFPTETLELLGLHDLKTNRDENPIQILTPKCRFGIFSDLEFTQKDYAFCTGGQSDLEIHRGISFFAKGSDYPTVFGESSNELLKSAHGMEYFERSPDEIQSKIMIQLKKIGVIVLKNEQDLPSAEQTVILDLSRAKVFRRKFEMVIPMKSLPIGASNRMLFVERNSPLIETLYREGNLFIRTLLPEEPLLIEKILKALSPYFIDEKLNVDQVKVVPHHVAQDEWAEEKSHVDSSKQGFWYVSPALNPELGERSLYVRISDLLTKKYKKQPIFAAPELFHP